ncbi:PI-PLC X domain-containing protein, partial [Mucuna pruriens]
MRSLPCLLAVILPLLYNVAAACSDGTCKLLDDCSSDGDCGVGLYCFSCPFGFLGSRCVRSTVTNQFNLLMCLILVSSLIASFFGQNNTLPFNKYAFLTTHNAFAIDGEPPHTGVPRVTVTNQEDSVTQQLNEPAIDTLKEVEAFLSANPTEIVTLILEDYVQAPNGLTKVFTDAGLMKYWFPLTSMPKNGQDWPLVSDMVAKNQRLLVFTSKRSKEQSEGIAYQWNYMVENQCKKTSSIEPILFLSIYSLSPCQHSFLSHGDGGMKAGSCPNRAESPPLNDTSKSLVLVNYFRTTPFKPITCKDNSGGLINMLHTCYGAAGNRWANFVAVDYYKRSEGGGSFQAVDTLNGKLLCGCDDVHTSWINITSLLSTIEKIIVTRPTI